LVKRCVLPMWSQWARGDYGLHVLRLQSTHLKRIRDVYHGLRIEYLCDAIVHRSRCILDVMVAEPFKFESSELSTTMDARTTSLNKQNVSAERGDFVLPRIDIKWPRTNRISEQPPYLSPPRKGAPAPVMRPTPTSQSSSITLDTVSPIKFPSMTRGESSSTADYWRARPEDAAEAWSREVLNLRREIAELREGGRPDVGDSWSMTTAPPLYDA